MGRGAARAHAPRHAARDRVGASRLSRAVSQALHGRLGEGVHDRHARRGSLALPCGGSDHNAQVRECARSPAPMDLGALGRVHPLPRRRLDARALSVLSAQDAGLRGLPVPGVPGGGRRGLHRSGVLALAPPPRAGLARARRERMTAAAILARGLGKDFGALRALDQLDLEVGDGEFFGLLGPNGAGKTTTVHLLATLLAPSRGTARVAGHDVAHEGLAVRRSIGLVFQDTTLDRDLTVAENLRFAARLWSLPGRVARPRIDALLRQFELLERRDDPVRTLSGGMRRAADIARGILHEPRILFLDEPTAGLDPRARRSLWDRIRGLRAASGVTVLLTTHYVEEAEPCDRVAVLDHGRLVALGTPADLKREAGVGSLEDVFLAHTGHPLAEAEGG